jgi:hypothetical protein
VQAGTRDPVPARPAWFTLSLHVNLLLDTPDHSSFPQPGLYLMKALCSSALGKTGLGSTRGCPASAKVVICLWAVPRAWPTLMGTSSRQGILGWWSRVSACHSCTRKSCSVSFLSQDAELFCSRSFSVLAWERLGFATWECPCLPGWTGETLTLVESLFFICRMG